MRISLICTAVLTLMASDALAQTGAQSGPQTGSGERLVGFEHASRSPIVARNGIAATSQPLATQVALDVLKAGGSAVDAAIAANAALGLMEPTGSGIGGDMYAIVWDPKTRRLYGYNGSGRSAAGLDLATARAKAKGSAFLPTFGAASVTVPGAVDGWFALHQRFGRRTMAQNLAPAIGYARDGFPVSQFIAFAITRNMQRLEKSAAAGDIEEFENARRIYLQGGKGPSDGQVWRNPDLAKTYELLAKGGRAAFYQGPVAKTVDAYMRRIGGWLRASDFAAHHGEWVEPVSVDYRGYEIWELPPNTQGIAALQMLRLIEPYDIAKMGPGSADAVHLMIEAKKLAYADRARLYADPSAMQVPVAGLLSRSYADERRKLLQMDRAAPAVEAGAPTGHGGTIYLTVADKDGMMVSWIQSNFRGLGSGLVPDGLGFMLQDRGNMFVTADGHPNVYAPNKRPFHTIIPGFATKGGKPWLSFGVMGGAMQPQGHVQVLVNRIDFGMDVQAAGDAARWQHVGSGTADDPDLAPGGAIILERGIAQATVDELQRRGHKVQPNKKEHFGSYEAIEWDEANGVYRAGTEMRVDGHAAGY